MHNGWFPTDPEIVRFKQRLVYCRDIKHNLKQNLSEIGSNLERRRFCHIFLQTWIARFHDPMEIMHKDAKSALQSSPSALFDPLHDLHHREIKITKSKVVLFNETIHTGK